MADIAAAVRAHDRNADEFASVYGLPGYIGPSYGDQRRAYVASIEDVRQHMKGRRLRNDNPCRFLLELGDLIAKVEVVCGQHP